MTPAQKAELHLTGARVVRVHERLAGAFSRSLFDPRRVSYPCATNDPSYTCLRELRVRADALLPPGAHIGLVPPAGWPADFSLQKNRIGNALRRTAVLPGEAAVALVGREQTGYGAPIEACGPYALVRTR